MCGCSLKLIFYVFLAFLKQSEILNPTIVEESNYTIEIILNSFGISIALHITWHIGMVQLNVFDK